MSPPLTQEKLARHRGIKVTPRRIRFRLSTHWRRLLSAVCLDIAFEPLSFKVSGPQLRTPRTADCRALRADPSHAVAKKQSSSGRAVQPKLRGHALGPVSPLSALAPSQ